MAGFIVTIDAVDYQKVNGTKIIEHKADYILAIKENQGHLYEDVQRLFKLVLKNSILYNM